MNTHNNQNVFLGATFLISEILLSFAIATIVKVLEPSLSIFQILFFRYLLCLPLLIIYARFSLGHRFLKINNPRILLLRTIFGFLGLLMWLLAVLTIDISLATALANTMSMFITILSVLIARESVGIRRASAVVFGFFGVLVLLLPFDAQFDILGVVYALLGAFFGGLMFVFIRILGKSDAVATTAIWYNSCGIIFSGFLCLLTLNIEIFNTSPLTVNIWIVLLSLGIIASFQQFFLAQSHSYAEASVLAPLHYISIPIGASVGVLFFNEIITIKFIIGTLIIIVSNYYILVREKAIK